MHKVCLSCLLAVVTRFVYVWGILAPLFPLVDNPSWRCGDRRSMYPDTVPDISQKEDSDGPRPVVFQSQCEGGQYLTSYRVCDDP